MLNKKDEILEEKLLAGLIGGRVGKYGSWSYLSILEGKEVYWEYLRLLNGCQYKSTKTDADTIYIIPDDC